MTTIASSVGNTEGLAIAPDGTAYVVVRDAANAPGLHRLEHDGSTTPLAAFERGVGATWWKGAVWVGRTGDAQGELLEITPEGEVTTHAVDAPPAPNFLTPTPWGTLLVADDFVDTIYEYDGAAATEAWTDVPSPNGMGLSPDGGTLYVASTFRSPGLTAVTVDDATAGAVAWTTPFDDGTTPDGLAVAADGSVVVALNVAGDLVTVLPDGTVRTFPVGDPATALTTPASLAFGRGSWDACAVLVTELFGQDVVQVDLGVTGFFPSWEEGPRNDAAAR